jgi:hypothetical protein
MTPLVTLHYGANGDTYRLPIHLEPHASSMFDIGELIRTQQLDQDGKTIPFDASQGSVIVGSAAGAPEDLINIAFAGGIYNPTKATCGGTCQMCQVGLISQSITPGIFTVTVGGQQPSWLQYVWSDGTHYDVTNSSNWSSTQPAVATVVSAGAAIPGSSPESAVARRPSARITTRRFQSIQAGRSAAIRPSARRSWSPGASR